MPQRPDTASGGEIESRFSVLNNYPVVLHDMDEIESKFREKRRDAMTLVWKFHIYDADGVAFLDENTGEMFSLWQFTPDTTFYNVTQEKKAFARQFADALTGHTELGNDYLTDAEINAMIDAGWAGQLIGRRALASFDYVKGTDGVVRLKIIKLRALGPQTQAAAPAAPRAPAPASTAPAATAPASAANGSEVAALQAQLAALQAQLAMASVPTSAPTPPEPAAEPATVAGGSDDEPWV